MLLKLLRLLFMYVLFGNTFAAAAISSLQQRRHLLCAASKADSLATS
jgi:hypothetical protein